MFKNKWIRVLGLFVFGAFISLVSMVGCGDDDGEGGPGDFISAECEICPCKYFDVPTTTGCWKEPALESEPSGPSFCLLADIASTGEPLMLVTTVEFACQILGFDDVPTCQTQTTTKLDQEHLDLSANVRAACRDCLAQYATALNQVIHVSGEQPFMCATPANQ